jgi:ABC-type proline/glycine betaine transport system permease subunit
MDQDLTMAIVIAVMTSIIASFFIGYWLGRCRQVQEQINVPANDFLQRVQHYSKGRTK